MPDQPIAVSLTVPAGPQEVGAVVPVSVRVRNVSDNTLWMLGVLDGSEAGFRYPHYIPNIQGPGPLPAPEGLPWCGMVMPLRREDFQELRPGESFDPTVPVHGAGYLPLATFAEFRPPAPGRYQLSLTISTESQDEEEWLGVLEFPGKAEVMALLAKVPHLNVESNLVVVEVR